MVLQAGSGPYPHPVGYALMQSGDQQVQEASWPAVVKTNVDCTRATVRVPQISAGTYADVEIVQPVPPKYSKIRTLFPFLVPLVTG